MIDDLFLNNLPEGIKLGPNGVTASGLRSKLRAIEKKDKKPSGYKNTEVCSWGRVDAVTDYIKTLHNKKLKNGKTLLDRKLKDNFRIEFIERK